MKQLITISFVLCFYLLAKAQTNPINLPPNDPTWYKVIYTSDEFSYPQQNQNYIRNAMKLNRWKFLAPWGNAFDVNTGNKTNISYNSQFGENVTVYNGICSLKVEKKPGVQPVPCFDDCYTLNSAPFNGTPNYQSYDYTNGQLISKNTFKYGYFELKFRLPNRSYTVYKNKGIQADFWFFPVTPCSIPDPNYQEIDVFETNSVSHYLMCPTIHYGGTNNGGPTQNDAWEDIGWGFNSKKGKVIWAAPLNYNINFDDGNFHIVGFEWMPEFVNIYVDGKLERSTNWHQNDMCEMNMIIDASAGSGFTDNPDTGSEFPFIFEIDYIRYYKPTVNIDPAYSANYPDYNVLGNHRREKIELGDYLETNNPWCDAKIPANKNLVLRARTEVGLYGGFETDDSGELYIDASSYLY